MDVCFLCNKHNRNEVSRPSHSIYEEEYWVVFHAPAEMRLLGTLLIASKFQFPFANNRRSKAAAAFERVWRNTYIALTTNMESEIEMILKEDCFFECGHYVLWIVSLRTEQIKRGIRFFEADESCREEDVIALENKLRETMG